MSKKCNHASFLRLRTFTQDYGSTATTVRGVLAAAKRVLANNPHAELYPTRRMLVSEWTQAQEIRRADPEAKRARDDRKFRRKYLASLRKMESETVRTVSPQSHVQLDDIARLRKIATGRAWCEPVRFARIPMTIDAADRVGAKVVRRGRNWVLCSTLGPWKHVHESGETQWKGGQPKKYTRATNITYVTSWGLIESPTVLRVRIDTTDMTLVLPAGYSWDIDANGLRAVHDATGDDYHPDADDVLDDAEHIASLIVLNRAVRRSQRRLEYIQSQPETLRVCFRDSITAGNCGVGTAAFCRRHNLDTRRHYTAAELLAISNGDAARVKLVVQAAARREALEMEQGYCVIADHRRDN